MNRYEIFSPRTIRKNTTQATVLPLRGGLVVSFSVSGRELLYCEPETVLDTAREVRGGIPILFPACGRLQEGEYDTVPKHGFARSRAWEVVDEREDALTLVLKSNPETLAQFPHPFVFTQTYRVESGKLVLTQCIENTGEGPLPFCLGFHPYFKVDPKVATATVPSDRYEDTTGKYAFDGTFAFCNDYDSVCTNTDSTASVLETGCGAKISVSASDAFGYTVVWSPRGAQFACIEPWTAAPNALNTGKDVITLAPGASAEFEFVISAS